MPYKDPARRKAAFERMLAQKGRAGGTPRTSRRRPNARPRARDRPADVPADVLSDVPAVVPVEVDSRLRTSPTSEAELARGVPRPDPVVVGVRAVRGRGWKCPGCEWTTAPPKLTEHYLAQGGTERWWGRVSPSFLEHVKTEHPEIAERGGVTFRPVGHVVVSHVAGFPIRRVAPERAA